MGVFLKCVPQMLMRVAAVTMETCLLIFCACAEALLFINKVGGSRRGLSIRLSSLLLEPRCPDNRGSTVLYTWVYAFLPHQFPLNNVCVQHVRLDVVCVCIPDSVWVLSGSAMAGNYVRVFYFRMQARRKRYRCKKTIVSLLYCFTETLQLQIEDRKFSTEQRYNYIKKI